MFTISKKAMNFRSLQDTICQNPKIIHISCHGSYDEQTKEFYLSIEDSNNYGLDEKLTQEKLKHILRLNSKMINNSQSGEINNSSSVGDYRNHTR